MRTIEYTGTLDDIQKHTQRRCLKEQAVYGGLIMTESWHQPQEIETAEDIMKFLEESKNEND